MDVVVITGPTASGKSDLAIRLAHKINGEIISADSLQIYKYMDIGTAKETNFSVPHHMIDIVTPDQAFSVADYQALAREKIDEVQKRGKIPIVTGGTGFYINALLYNVTFEEEPDYAYRDTLIKLAKEKGEEELYNMLKNIDPDYAKTIHQNNVAKISRAIEYHKTTGKKLSEHNNETDNKKPMYNHKTFIIDIDREILYKRINQRVDIMIEQGLIEEVKTLLKMGYTKDLAPMGSIGYKEIVKYINGEIFLDKALCDIKQNTRRYAKRQITWLRNKTDGCWIKPDEEITLHI